jgi:hypothetical protein
LFTFVQLFENCKTCCKGVFFTTIDQNIFCSDKYLASYIQIMLRNARSSKMSVIALFETKMECGNISAKLPSSRLIENLSIGS